MPILSLVPGRRATVASALLALALVVCSAALAENYRYMRTARDSALAASMLLRKADFPSQLGLSGGRVTPAETASNDLCDGAQPKQSDLVITGDAETRFSNAAAGIIEIDSEIQAFKTVAMARTDFARQLPFLNARCGAQLMKQEHVTLITPWHVAVKRTGCLCDEMATITFESASPREDLHLLWIISGVRRGRFEAMVLTTVGKSTSDTQHAAENAALGLHARSLEAVGLRLRRHR